MHKPLYTPCLCDPFFGCYFGLLIFVFIIILIFILGIIIFFKILLIIEQIPNLISLLHDLFFKIFFWKHLLILHVYISFIPSCYIDMILFNYLSIIIHKLWYFVIIYVLLSLKLQFFIYDFICYFHWVMVDIVSHWYHTCSGEPISKAPTAYLSIYVVK